MRKEKNFSFGVVGGADGPTAGFLSNSSEKLDQESKWNDMLEACKKLIKTKSCAITGDELKQHLIEEYGANEIEILDGQKLGNMDEMGKSEACRLLADCTIGTR